MAEVARFRGIMITMYCADPARHPVAHFHARYSKHRASFMIEPPTWLAGMMPSWQMQTNGPVFEPLRNLDLFNQVQLNIDTGTIEWPTGADFSPSVLHDWPQYQDKILAGICVHHTIPA